MLIASSRRFIQAPFDSEEELERVLVDNYEHIFGPSAIYLPRALIKTPGGYGTIPDGFAFDLSKKQWFIVEAELAKHDLWNHIAPQIAKQITAASKPETKLNLVDRVVSLFREDQDVQNKFEEEGIELIDVRKVLDQILATAPCLGMPIDSISPDLSEWAKSIRLDTKLWLIKKYVELGNSANVIYEFPEEYRPVLDTERQTEGTTDTFDIGLQDLIKAGQLAPGSKLYMSYKPNSSQERKTYEVIVENDGSLRGDDQSFSPSYAAVYYINKAGNPRKTANGWNVWKTEDGLSLADLRDNYLREPRAERQWDEQSFFNEMDSRRGPEELRIARDIFEWAKDKLPIFWWGRGKFDGSFFPGLEHKGISYYPIAIWTYGKVEIQFQWLKTKPPFNNESKRKEIVNKLNQIPNVNIPEDAITRRPNIPLLTFKEDTSLKQFQEVLNSMIKEILSC
jgi:hypothetical protein